MTPIQLLDQNTINQIAAGEVVDRPSSVVKELLENAIDAKASAVTVEIKEGGIPLIRITDNGCGIPKEEVKIAFLQHSTSKIRSAIDLLNVGSLGFRGEALSSIAAVSKVELITKTPQALTGTCYTIEGGEEKSIEEIGAPDGTTFLVKELFYNVPARRKFLKTSAAEAGYINELVEKIALSNPNVSIRLISNGTTKLYTSGNNKRKDLIYTIYGREISANLIPVQIKKERIEIEGFLGKPVISRGNRSFENYFINGRYVKSKLISKSIETAYQPFMMNHRYPFTVLDIRIPAESIDVNVHPAKMELRFKNEIAFYEQLTQILVSVLEGKEFIPEIALGQKASQNADTEQAAGGKQTADRTQESVNQKDKRRQIPEKPPEPFEKRRLEAEAFKQLASFGKPDRFSKSVPSSNYSALPKHMTVNETKTDRSDCSKHPNSDSPLCSSSSKPPEKPVTEAERKNGEKAAKGREEKEEKKENRESAESAEASKSAEKTEAQISLFQAPLLSKEARIKHHLIGQLFDTYWLIQYEDKLFIMDQHAAHEKVLYERTIASLKTKEFTSQLLSPPWIVSLTDAEEALLMTYQDNFKELGYDFSHFGGREYAIHAVPGNLFGLSEKEMFIELLSELESDFKSSKQPSALLTEKIAALSCKAAVKGNSSMSFPEADALMEELMQLENPYACPHGRPTIISMSKYEIEKKFKRIV